MIAPKTLLGRSKATERSALEMHEKAFKDFGTPGKKVSAAYGSIGKRSLVMFAAQAGHNPDATEMLDLVEKQFKIDYQPIEAGPLGGAARCTSLDSGTSKLTQCIWASTDVFGIIYFAFVSPAEAEKQFLKARAQIEVAA